MKSDPLNIRPAVDKFLHDMGRVALWVSVNEYAAACGGDTSDKTVSDRRMVAVVAVEQVVVKMMSDRNELANENDVLRAAIRLVVDAANAHPDPMHGKVRQAIDAASTTL